MLDFIGRIRTRQDLIKQPAQAAINMLGRLLLNILGGISNKPPPKTINSILVIRRNRIGDAVCTLPWIQSIKASQPEVSIDVLCNDYNFPVYKNSYAVDYAYVIPQKFLGIKFLQALHPDIRKLKRKNYDVVMNAGGFSSRSALLAFMVATNYCIGIRSSKGHLFDRFWSNSIRHDDLDGSTHQVYRVAAIGDLTGLPHTKPLPYAKLSTKRASDPLNSTPSALLCPLVNRKDSRWPDYRWKSLAIRLMQNNINVSWLTHAPTNAPGELLKAKQTNDKKTNFFSTEDLIGIIPRFSIIVCSEGGISHLAPALGTPCLALSGANIFDTWRPWSDLCLLIEEKNILDIQENVVVNATLQQLRNHASNGKN